MFNLILHYVVYGLFECYLFCSFWLFRITFLDRLYERMVLSYFENAEINVVLAYKGLKQDEQKSTKKEIIKSKTGWPTIFVNDRRFFAALATYPTLGIFESFIVSFSKELIVN